MKKTLIGLATVSLAVSLAISGCKGDSDTDDMGGEGGVPMATGGKGTGGKGTGGKGSGGAVTATGGAAETGGGAGEGGTAGEGGEGGEGGAI